MTTEQKVGFKGYRDRESNLLIESVVFSNGKQYYPTTEMAGMYLRRISQGNCSTEDLKKLSKDPKDPYKLDRVKAYISGINQGLISIDLQIRVIRTKNKATDSVHIIPLHFTRR